MSCPRRLPPAAYEGTHHVSLTFCTSRRQRHFDDRAMVDLVTLQILRTARRLQFEVAVYCFMPDHLHLLVAGIDRGADLRVFVHRLKQATGFEAARRGIELWQPSWFESTLRDDEDELRTIAYIVNNPVRAGLVLSPADWPAWGSQVFTRQQLIEAIGAWVPAGARGLQTPGSVRRD